MATITVINFPGKLIMLSVSLISYLLNKKINIALVLSLLVRKETGQRNMVPVWPERVAGTESGKCSAQGGPRPGLIELLPWLLSKAVLSSARHCHSQSSACEGFTASSLAGKVSCTSIYIKP